MDFILDAISKKTPINSSQDLFWRLATIEKLDWLGSCDHPVISTMPDVEGIVQAILEQLHYFRNPGEQQLYHKLIEIFGLAVQLWKALRRDNCRVDFDYRPSLTDWTFVPCTKVDSQNATIPPSGAYDTKLPSEEFVLFPKITGFFESTDATILHKGIALPHGSPVFRECLQEIHDVKQATEEFQRGLRKRAGTQSSPVLDHRQVAWHAPQARSN